MPATWSDPHTWTPGELVGATALNTEVRDNLLYLMTPNNFNTLSTAAFSTTATTLATLTSTALVVAGGGPVVFAGSFAIGLAPGGGNAVMVYADIDGTQQLITSGGQMTNAMHFMTFWTGLSKASHTLSLKWMTNAGTVTAYMTGTQNPLRLWAVEW